MGNGQPYPFGAIDLSQKGDSSQLYDWAENFVYRVPPSISYYTSMYDHDNAEATESMPILGESDWMIDNRSFNEDTQMWEEGDSIIHSFDLSMMVTSIGKPVFKKGIHIIF